MVDDSESQQSRLLEPTSTVAARRSNVPVLRIVGALVAVQASFGGNAVITKLALGRNADPVVYSFLRDVGGGAVLLIACRALDCLVWPRRADLGTFILLGVLGVYIAQMFLVMALQHVEPLHAMLIQPIQPVITVLLAAACGVEPLHCSRVHGRLKLAGVLLAAVGAACTVYYARRGESAAAPSTPSGLVTGYSMLAVQCVAGALYQLVQKHLLSTADYPPLAVAAMGYVVGACAIGLTLPVCKLEPEHWAFVADPLVLGALAYAVLMTSAFNYGAQAYANKHSSPTLVTAFFPLQVCFTALFSWLALGQRPRMSDYAGGAMIVGGLASVTAGRVLHARQCVTSKSEDGMD